MNKKSLTYLKESSMFAIGELSVAALTVLIYFGLSFAIEQVIFSYKVITGAALGSFIMIANYTALSFYISRVADSIMALRGKGDMTDEQIEKFTRENVSKIQKSVQLSFIIRTACMIGALILAFISKQFDVVATVIPLLAFRPIIAFCEIVTRKRACDSGEIKSPESSSSNDASEGADGQ